MSSSPISVISAEDEHAFKNCELIYPPEEYLDKCYTFSNIPSDVYVYMQEKFVKACSSTAEISDVDTTDTKGDIKYTIIVCILLSAIIIATIYMLTSSAIKAFKNRGKLNK